MEIKGNDLFNVIGPTDLSIDYQKSLCLLYLPVIGADAFAVYNLLNNWDYSGSFSQLCSLTGLDIVKLSEALKQLEEFKLLKTYYQKSTGIYRFFLQAPLSGAEFLNQNILGRLYLKQVGKESYEFVEECFEENGSIMDDEIDITSQLDMSRLKDWNDLDELSFQNLKQQGIYENTAITFDTKKFLNGLSDLMWNKAERTPEALHDIASMGSFYGIDETDMRKLVGKSCSDEGKDLDFEKLRRLCLDANTQDSDYSIDDYSVENIDYLFNLQNKLKVTNAEKTLIENLKMNFNLSTEVLNYLFRYAYENNDKKITKKYCEKVAKDWALHDIDTVEKAEAYVSDVRKPHGSKLPDFHKEAELPQQDIQSLRAKLFKDGD